MAENPLGIVGQECARRDNGKVLLFYGDSFVAGTGACEDSIPHQLGTLLPDYAVYDYGVGG